MQFPSKLVEEAVDEIAKMPGIGKKTALRMALFLLREKKEYAESLAQALRNLRLHMQYCKHCYSMSDGDICRICGDPDRDRTLLCIVENVHDVMAVEHTAQYKGLYHVLGGVLSPLEGVGPEQLHIGALTRRVRQQNIQEIIFALRTTIEGDTTAFYIAKQLKGSGMSVQMSMIARGVAMGSELEYTDEVTLGKSISLRVPYQ